MRFYLFYGLHSKFGLSTSSHVAPSVDMIQYRMTELNSGSPDFICKGRERFELIIQTLTNYSINNLIPSILW